MSSLGSTIHSDLTDIFHIADYLHDLFKHFDRVVLIDVGCAMGDFKALLRLDNLYSVGIDPLLEDYQKRRHHQLATYNVLLPVAIDIHTTEVNFYVTESLDTSSLRMFNLKNISTKNAFFGSEKPGVFYIPRKIKKKVTKVIDQRKMIPQRLDDVLTRHHLHETPIHILKIDAQGSDLNVLKSCGNLIRQVMYIVFESTYDEAATLYLGSSKFSEDDAFLQSQGFSMIAKAQLLKHDCDCLYVNRRMCLSDGDL